MSSFYRQADVGVTTAPTSFRAVRTRSLAALFALLVMVCSVLFSVASASQTAFAAEDEDQKIEDLLNDKSKDFGAKDYQDAMSKLDSNNINDQNSFGYVLGRLFMPGYLNHTDQGVAAKGMSNPGTNCSLSDPNAGTPLYHNCDVPNIMAEFLQTMVSTFVPQGMQNATTDYAKVENPWFGLPTRVPGGTVPVDDSLRSAKYTGLELFGYSMKYTSYNGEWDNIKVFTKARALSNFGAMDTLTLGVHTIVNGITSGAQKAGQNVSDSLSRGDILGAIGGAFTGFFEGGTSSSLNTILDSSDLNVFNTNSWYRLNYGSTAYGFRELTDEEVSQRMLAEIQDHLSGRTDGVKLPQDFLDLEGGPDKPKEDIASCQVTDTEGKKQEKSSRTGGGMSESDCAAAAKAANPEHPDYDWTVDGLQKKEKLSTWKDRNKQWFDTAKKYEFTCEIKTDEEKRTDNLASFYACVDSQFAEKSKDQTQKMRDEGTADWVKKAINSSNFSKFLTGSSAANLNSPKARLVCVDANGRDRLEGGQPVYAYDSNGNFQRDKCGQIRQPIQNGLFGNGYDDNVKVPKDTRYTVMTANTPMGITTPPRLIAGTVSNFGMSTSMLMTRIANTMVNLSFSPLTQTLGLDDVVVNFIDDVKDSLFFSTSVLLVAASALVTVFTTFFTRQYRRGLMQLLYLFAMGIVSTALLATPRTFMKLTDDVPAAVEATIATAIFDTGSAADGDQLCTATGNPVSYDGENQTLFTYADTGNREMQCQIWRIFAFNTWVNGQWGTDYHQLFANGAPGAEHHLENTNSDLVGDAAVKMGGQATEKNWALYQLDMLTQGTTTDTPEATGTPLGQVDPNMYRVVDAQAGPNNGAGTDGRHFMWWSGGQPEGRMVYALAGATNSVVGLIAILIFSTGKIVLTMVTLFMFLALPFMLLVGMFYHGGARLLSKYGWTMLSLMVERVFLVALLALLLRLLVLSGSAIDNFLLACVVCMGMSIAAIMLRKKLMGQIRNGIVTPHGGSALSQISDFSLERVWKEKTPKTIRNAVHNTGVRAKAAGSGLVAGAILTDGSLSSMSKSVRQSVSDAEGKTLRAQRREGFSMGQKLTQAADAGRTSAMFERKRDNVSFSRVDRDISKELQERVNEQQGGTDTTRTRRHIPTSDMPGKVDTRQSAKTARTAKKAARTLEDRERAEDKAGYSQFSKPAQDALRQNPTIEDVSKEQSQVKKASATARKKAREASERYGRLVSSMADREAQRIEERNRQEQFSASVQQMVQRFDRSKDARGAQDDADATGDNTNAPQDETPQPGAQEDKNTGEERG